MTTRESAFLRDEFSLALFYGDMLYAMSSLEKSMIYVMMVADLASKMKQRVNLTDCLHRSLFRSVSFRVVHRCSTGLFTWERDCTRIPELSRYSIYLWHEQKERLTLLSVCLHTKKTSFDGVESTVNFVCVRPPDIVAISLCCRRRSSFQHIVPKVAWMMQIHKDNIAFRTYCI